MRIGMIVPGFSADEEDWCIPAVRDLVRELSGRHELHVFALRYPHRRGSHAIEGATVHTLGGGLVGGAGRIGLYARSRARILAVHRHRGLQALHALWADEPGFLAVTAGRALRLPTVVSLMGGELARLPDIGYGGQLGRVGRILTRHALRRASAVTAGSAWLTEMTRPHVRGRRLLELPLGVDPGRFHPAAAGEAALHGGGELKLLHVASLVPVKDQAMLLRAFARVIRPAAPATIQAGAAHLHIVGDGPLRRPLEELADELRIASRVTFHGAVPHDRMPAFYRDADFCILSSRHESQGMVALEAAASGIAIVGTAVGILPELVPADRLVLPGDDARLATVITRLLHEPRMMEEMGKAARQRVLDRFTTARTTAAVDALYDEVVAEEHPL